MLVDSNTIVLYTFESIELMRDMSQQPSTIFEKPTMTFSSFRILESRFHTYTYLTSYTNTYARFDKEAGALTFMLKPMIKPKGAREIDATVLAIIGEDDEVVGIELLLSDKGIVKKINI